MSKHTNGPWKAYEASERCPLPVGCPVEVGTETGKGRRTDTICEMVGQGNGKYDPVVTWANARLIAAAPDLLKACKDVLSTIEGGDNDDSFIRAMQEAVKKAEGGE